MKRKPVSAPPKSVDWRTRGWRDTFTKRERATKRLCVREVCFACRPQHAAAPASNAGSCSDVTVIYAVAPRWGTITAYSEIARNDFLSYIRGLLPMYRQSAGVRLQGGRFQSYARRTARFRF